MQMCRLLGPAVLGIAAVLVGCGDDAGPVDSGMQGPDDDLPALQFGPDISLDDAQLIDLATAMAADFSCLGTLTQPAPGAVISFNMTVKDFQEDNPVPDVCIKFYADDVVPATDTCNPASDLVTDVDGVVTVMDAARSWYAYRIFPQMGPTPATTIVGSVQYNEASPSDASGQVDGNSVSQATINLIPTVLGFRREAGTAVVAGTINDCGDEPVYGARVQLYAASGEPIAEGRLGSEPHYKYFDGDDFPNSTQPWSHRDGLFVIANLRVPADGTPFFMELRGRLTEGGEVQVLGCEQGTLFADTVTILNVGPTRSDGPACPNL